MGPGAKSYLRKGFPIYEEMRKYFPIDEEAASHVVCNCSTRNFLIYEESLFFFFISVGNGGEGGSILRQKKETFMTGVNRNISK